MQHVHWTCQVTSIAEYQMASIIPELVHHVKAQKMRYFGHIL